jgi:hypothetical protein
MHPPAFIVDQSAAYFAFQLGFYVRAAWNLNESTIVEWFVVIRLTLLFYQFFCV